MGLARDEKIAAAEGRGCLGKAADDEPVFILRAKDKFAPVLVRFWVALVTNAHAGSLDFPTYNKLLEARKLVREMERWQARNGCKVPD